MAKKKPTDKKTFRTVAYLNRHLNLYEVHGNDHIDDDSFLIDLCADVFHKRFPGISRYLRKPGRTTRKVEITIKILD